MTDTITAGDVVGSPLIDSADSKVGTIGQLYVDDQTGQPQWVTVNTGFFGTSESFVPIADASYDGASLSVPFTKDKIKGAPNVSPDGDHLPEAEEGALVVAVDGVIGDQLEVDVPIAEVVDQVAGILWASLRQSVRLAATIPYALAMRLGVRAEEPAHVTGGAGVPSPPSGISWVSTGEGLTKPKRRSPTDAPLPERLHEGRS